MSISQSLKKSSFQSESEILSQPMTVTVNDKERVCHNGVLEGFKNAVKMIDDLQKENRSLKNENAELHKQLEANQEKSQKKSRSEGMSY
jgi:cell shape-determining protein MreC